MKDHLPTIFISHGAPTLPLEDIPARKFLERLGPDFNEVDAVLCISAHWQTTIPTINATENPETIHDFYGFQEELYKIKYLAHGNLWLAENITNMVKNAGLSCKIDYKRGLDHGAWVPMMLMYPDANIPVIQLSIQSHLNPLSHLKLGRTLNELRKKNILIIGSGGAVHPLGYPGAHFRGDPSQWAKNFDNWLTNVIIHGNEQLLINYRHLAPYPEKAHPYPDHYMPLAVAFGAAGKGAKGTVIHHSWMGDLGMAAYQFDNMPEMD